MGRQRYDGGRLRDGSGQRTRCADDCCEDPCCSTGSPTASFYFTQDDDDPCTIDFFDTSEEGDCGAIVSWSWKRNGTEFSTSQNPANVDLDAIGSAPHNITLTVTDATGCTDTTDAEAIPCVECSYTLGVTDISESVVDDCNYTYSATINNPTAKTIQKYLWYADGVPIGTGTTASYQDTEGCHAPDIKLVIVDENGCTAERTEAFPHDTCIDDDCDCYALGDLPGATVEVTLNSILAEDTSFGGSCSGCASNNTTYELSLGATPCRYEYSGTFDCDGTTYDLILEAFPQAGTACTGEWRVRVITRPSSFHAWTCDRTYKSPTINDDECVGSFTCTFHSTTVCAGQNTCQPQTTGGSITLVT